MTFIGLLIIALVLIFLLDGQLKSFNYHRHQKRVVKHIAKVKQESWHESSKFLPLILIVCMSLVCAACGGGSSAKSSPTTPVVPDGVPASIVTNPVSQTVPVGTPATFTVVATGTEPITYAWTMNGNPVGTNSATFVTGPTTSSDNGAVVQVDVSNAYSDPTSSPATLTVESATSNGGAAATFVQENDLVIPQLGATTLNTTFVVPFKNSVVTGHTEYAAFTWNVGENGGCGNNGTGGACQVPSVTSVVDDAGNILQFIATYAQTQNINPTWLYGAASVSGQPSKITISTALTGCTGACGGAFTGVVLEYTPGPGTGLDNTIGGTGTASPLAFPALITHDANDLILAVVQSNGCTTSGAGTDAPLAGNGFTLRTTPGLYCFAVEDTTATTAGTESAEFFESSPTLTFWEGLEVALP